MGLDCILMPFFKSIPLIVLILLNSYIETTSGIQSSTCSKPRFQSLIINNPTMVNKRTLIE
jgi:hypothetical protein